MFNLNLQDTSAFHYGVDGAHDQLSHFAARMGSFVTKVVESSWIIINHRLHKYNSSSSLSSSQHFRCFISYQSPPRVPHATWGLSLLRSNVFTVPRRVSDLDQKSTVAVFGQDLKRIIRPHVSMFDVHFTKISRNQWSEDPKTTTDWGSNFSQGSTGGCFFVPFHLWNESVHQIEKEALNCCIPEMWRMDTPNVFLILGNFGGCPAIKFRRVVAWDLWNLFYYGAKVLWMT